MKLKWDYRVCNHYHYWYYNQTIYPETDNEWVSTEGIDLLNEISKYDMIIILSTDANLPNLDWKFIEDGYNLFFY